MLHSVRFKMISGIIKQFYLGETSGGHQFQCPLKAGSTSKLDQVARGYI